MEVPVCRICGRDLEIVACSSPSSIFPFPICASCLTPSYGANERVVGRPSVLPTFSVEFEIHTASDCARARALVLLQHGYKRTIDGTVSDEYKSPIYQALSAFRQHLPLLDELAGLVDDACGTHLHVGFPFHLRERLTKVRFEVFGPLVEYCYGRKEETAWFWGRTFCHYACSSLRTDYAGFCTESRYETIEYRLPRFITAQQYMEVVRFCRRVTYWLRQLFSTLEAFDDPYGEGRHAQRLALSPACIGERLLQLYRDTLSRSHHRLQRAASTRLLTTIAS